MEVKQFPIFSIILFKLDDLMHDSIMESNGGKLRITITMIIFGTIGVVRRYIPYSSAMISFFRGFISALILLVLGLISNKKIKGVEGKDRTIIQMAVAALTVLPYWLLTDNLAELTFGFQEIALLLVACIVCTALPYSLYFSAIQVVKAQTAALLSYIDPIVAVLLSALFLKEKMSTLTLIGIILVIGSALISETSKENMNE